MCAWMNSTTELKGESRHVGDRADAPTQSETPPSRMGPLPWTPNRTTRRRESAPHAPSDAPVGVLPLTHNNSRMLS
jgi:hypothetical protein